METENKGKALGSMLVAALIIGTALMSGLTAYNYSLAAHHMSKAIVETTAKPDQINLPGYPVSVALNIKVLDNNGSLMRDVTYPNDLILNNFIEWWAIMTLGTTESMTNDAGSAGNVGDTLYAVQSGSYGNFYTFGGPLVGAGGYIGIGTGSTSPARTDYALTTKVGSYSAVDSAIYIQSAQTITFASGFTLTSGATISEAGYFTKAASGSYYMLFHDTFAGIAVSADQSVQIQYTLNLPATTMVNLAVYLAAALQSCLASSESATCYNEYTMTTTSGAAVTAGSLAMFGVYDCGYECYCPSLACLSSDYLLVGTGSAVTTVTDHMLDAQVGPTTTSETTTLDLTNHKVLALSTIPLTTGYTISESGLYVTSTVAMGTSPGNYQFMFTHNNFTGVAG
ncbi:MAG: hypothetical protein JRN15_17055 [Nitrososphaerota archaeon]|nr:hypothetical protein [Nitrososphaerota archaeon]